MDVGRLYRRSVRAGGSVCAEPVQRYFAGAVKKRPAPSDVASDLPQPSPAKKRIIELPNKNAQSEAENHQPSNDIPATAQAVTPAVQTVFSKPGLGMRRPSGYFAQRRSLAGGAPAPLMNSSVANRQTSESADVNDGKPTPKKTDMRRASIAAVPRKDTVQDENEPSLRRAPLSTKFVSLNEPTREAVIPEVIVTPEDSQDDDDMEVAEDDEQVNTLQWRANVSNEHPAEGQYEPDDDLVSCST